jgi:hypothetical protein
MTGIQHQDGKGTKPEHRLARGRNELARDTSYGEN